MRKRCPERTRSGSSGHATGTSARGKGVAEAIIDALVTAAENPVELNVYDNNPRAHAFYKRYGFIDVRRTDYGQPGVTMRLMDTPSDV
jgi:ribosomal protein S18 acetylase RimI-like enzyme